MTYSHALIPVFPYSILGTKERVTELVTMLLEEGSSFAVTMDHPYTLWMSAASWHHVSGYIPEDLD